MCHRTYMMVRGQLAVVDSYVITAVPEIKLRSTVLESSGEGINIKFCVSVFRHCTGAMKKHVDMQTS